MQSGEYKELHAYLCLVAEIDLSLYLPSVACKSTIMSSAAVSQLSLDKNFT